jgi:hypothetical protein
MLIPVWRHAEKGWIWFPYVPRAARVHNWTIHFIAGCVIPPGVDSNKDGDYNDRGDFRTGAQTHGSLIWFSNKTQWVRKDLVNHEERHTKQEWVFGPSYLLLYGGSWLVNFVRFKGDSVKAYLEIPFEKDARAHET